MTLQIRPFDYGNQDYEPKKLVAWTREDQAGGIQFLTRREFKQVMRVPESELDLTTFDATPFQTTVERVTSGNLTVKTLAELLESDPDCKTKLYDTVWEMLKDVPMPDPLTRYPQDIWEKRTFENPGLMPEGWYLALDGDQYVGLTALWRNQGNEELLETGLTGVLRSHRRQGIATALKVLAIEYARSQGYKRVRTDNEENNPMFQINLRLGFKATPAALDFVKHLS